MLIVSPHLDDAVLSCGALAGEPRVVVASVFTRYANDDAGTSPSPPPRGLARRLLQAWGASDAREAEAIREREDVAACALLGFERRDLGMVDAAFRERPLPPFGELTPDDEALIGVVAARLVAEHERLGPGAVIAAPLAIGAHVDHAICHAAATAAGRMRNARVLFYADVPYCWRAADPEPALAAVSFPADAAVSAWLGAILCYASQISLLFPEEKEAPGTLERSLRAHLVGGCLVLREASTGASS